MHGIKDRPWDNCLKLAQSIFSLAEKIYVNINSVLNQTSNSSTGTSRKPRVPKWVLINLPKVPQVPQLEFDMKLNLSLI